MRRQSALSPGPLKYLKYDCLAVAKPHGFQRWLSWLLIFFCLLLDQVRGTTKRGDWQFDWHTQSKFSFGLLPEEVRRRFSNFVMSNLQRF